MANLNTTVPSPNLSPPMYAMETQLAYQGMVTKYAQVGALAVLIWDILDNIPEDYRLFFGKQQAGRKLNLPIIAYITSRVAALGYHLTSTIFSTAPISNCALLDRIADAWCPLSVAASGFLFFIRLKAIYNHNRNVIAAFFVLWVGLAVGGICSAIGVKGGLAGETQYCEDVSVAAFAFYGEVAPLVFDTLVFLAISWRLSNIASMDDKSNFKSMLFGTHLPDFTKSLLQDGQIYYVITIVAGISSIMMMFRGLERPSPLSDLMEDVYLVLVNIMAGRVFRRTRSGRIRELEISTSMIMPEPIKFAVQSEEGASVCRHSLVVQELHTVGLWRPVNAANIYLSYHDAPKTPTVNSVTVDKADVYLSYRDVKPDLVDAADVYLSCNNTVKTPTINSVLIDNADVYLSRDVKPDFVDPTTVNSVLLDKADMYLSYRDVTPALVDAAIVYTSYYLQIPSKWNSFKDAF